MTGRVETGVIAAGWGGRVTAVAVLCFPLVQPRLFGVEPTLLDTVLFFVIAMFLWTGASQSIAAAQIRTRLADVVARDLARRTLAVPTTCRWPRPSGARRRPRPAASSR